ncbi:MAG: serine hydrolase domain-containing protein [Pirellulaceae bacterium]
MNRIVVSCCGLLLFSSCLLSLFDSDLSADESKSVAEGLPHVDPKGLGMRVDRLRKIDDVVDDGIRRGNMPGCVVCIGYRGNIVWLKAYGDRQVEPEREPMTTDTVFDLASLTKPIATATSVMLLAERGAIEVDAPVSKYLPDFVSHGKDTITIGQLLTHQSGLIPDNALSDYTDGERQAMQRIRELDLRSTPGTKFAYSDVGFIVLGDLVRSVSGESLGDFTATNLFEPLGMVETGFLPDEVLRKRAAPTQQRDGKPMRGEVHDPRAFLLGGVAGHAGLFSTAEDLAKFAQMLINGGELETSAGTKRIMDETTVRQMTARRQVSSGWRTFGWDAQSPYSSNRGDLFSDEAFGHGGFTGTAIWIDPPQEMFVIFLSNRVHPDGKGSVNSLAGRIATLAAAAIP